MRPAPLSFTLLAAMGLAHGAHAFTPAGNDAVYEVGDEAFEGYYSPARSEARGMVLMVHDWDGLGDYERQRADMLAEQGFDAFAVDLFGQNNRPETTEDRQAATRALYSDRERMRELTLAGLAEAREQEAAENVVIMGYCFGGAVALEIARSGEAENVAGYTSFHGGVATPEGQEWPEAVPPLLIAHGGADTNVTMEDVSGLVEELEAIEAIYTVEIYSGAPHGFTEFESERYQERADEASWAAFQTFLKEAL
ncbi:dienelactone hydrolase family protein [Billgrantia diversa]|uniref:dienelactone hydrolase family protein n=1 Tax=Halomonas sp. MCCC 1A13316 TaxID=2733487 RepID=UPI0018A3D76A|nr:dienelactone hydrolase family protein [Halomonas sp. MCCC 1A13316]QOR37317.1 dienelactone hydrolase family protein [Halomonas sp. MCCC 1A13316]